MSSFSNSKPARAQSLFEVELSPGSSPISMPGPTASTRYYFNLTDGDALIRDEVGIEAPSIQAAVVSAMEAVEELRAQDPSSSDEWLGWRLEIVDALGCAVQSIPLDALSAH